jgi:serine/threonine protein kinase
MSSLLIENSGRCLRGLNKAPLPKARIEPEHPLDSPEPLATLDAPDLIARYEVEPIPSMSHKVLAKGNFGTVTRAFDPRKPKNQTAVKWFAFSTDWNMFRREVQALITLQQPCIVKLLGWSRRRSNSFEFWMKLASNGGLGDRLEYGSQATLGFFRNPAREAVIICDIVTVMKYIHSHGIIHRDLMPANIMLGEHGRGIIANAVGWNI